MIGQVLDGRYQVLRKLGEGGMGEVYAARHVRLGKEVALKLLRHEIVSNQEAVKRFEQEARSASSIGHKNIIGLLDSGELPDGRIYLSMELLEGAPLNELILQPVPPDRLLNILIQTGHGLAAAHKKGIVHRDMKPENVFVTITPEGEDIAKILDFGIAKVSGADGNNHLTKTGTIFGTPFYMAPEQALGQNVDQRADVYAVGVIMYECFCGAVPFQGESFMGILTQHITAEPKPPSRMAAEHGRTLPPGVEEIILHAMRKDPEHRFQSMDELIAALVGAYRTIAGAGMSTFLHAYPTSGAHAAPTAAALPVRAAATPMPYGRPPSSDSSSPYHIPQAPPPSGAYPGAPPAHGPLSPLPQMASDSYVVDQPHGKKSRVGLIIALIVILLGAGGAAAFFLFFNKDGGDDKTAEAGQTEESPPDPTSGKGVTPPPPVVADAGAAVQTPPPATPDAGVTKPVVVKPPIIKKPKPLVQVLVNSRPQGADIIAADGKKIGTTPAVIKVPKGTPVRLTLKRRRHKDESITLDGTKEKETYTLERVGRPDRPDRPGRPDPDEGGTEPGPRDPCANPRSIECKCSKDPSLPECGLE
ncbi:MAG TPA: serine/threonine-protein kinase [Kofleriaceae bacterium]|nr:serine/threonine-protein kinase [Kofleriaceae bacterium]